MSARVQGLRPGLRLGLWQRPADWQQAIDFVGPSTRTSVWGWALLGVGLLMALQASDAADAIDQARQAQASEQRRLSHAWHRHELAQQAGRAPALPHGAARGADAPAADRAGGAGQVPVPAKEDWRQVALLAEGLSHDWLGTLDRVDAEATAAHVALTGLSLDLGGSSGAAEVRLQAAVPDDEVALRWVARLGELAQLRSRQALNTPFDGPHGHYLWRVEAVWPEAQP